MDDANFIQNHEIWFPDKSSIHEINKRQEYQLPHSTAEAAIYHVIFRLHDSLPAGIQNELSRDATKAMHAKYENVIMLSVENAEEDVNI